MAKKPSRSQLRQRLLDAAASVVVPKACDVAVIGGGAAGLVAAITAAEAGASVLVLERDLECGRPILDTGNGRCNFANANLDPQRYNDPPFVEAVCEQRWLDDVLTFFDGCGLRWVQEDDRLYPMSRVSASVRNVLLARARAAGVVLAPARSVQVVRKRMADRSAEITFSQAFARDASCTVVATAVVVATGGTALPALADFDLQSAQSEPVLCPLACEHSPLVALDGRRVHAKAALTKTGDSYPSWYERGEVLFRSYGLSGIVTFDLSRRARPGDLVELDLLPDLDRTELYRRADPNARGTICPGALDGLLDPQIAAILEHLAPERLTTKIAGLPAPKTDTEELVSLVKGLPFRVVGPTETDHAQVMRGGLLTSQFDAKTLASRAHGRLFACGEALDVDADCGGFNLAWAWKSGMVAGSAAAHLAHAEVSP